MYRRLRTEDLIVAVVAISPFLAQVADALFDQGVETYRLPVDLNGKMRNASSVTSGAVTR